MKVTIDIPAATIANLMCSAIESGDPVTTAMKGGWCWGIYYRSRGTTPPKCLGDHWYVSKPDLFEERAFQMEVIEVADENTFKWSDDRDFNKTTEINLKSGALKSHIVRRHHLIGGLETMALQFPEQFSQIIKDDTDAPCADAFLQAVLFGEEKYA